MSHQLSLEPQELVLNRFFVAQLTEDQREVYQYNCSFNANPEPGTEQKALASICYKLGIPAIRLGNKIITQQLVDPEKISGSDWNLISLGKTILNAANSFEKKGLETLERRKLEKHLKAWQRTEIERAPEGGLIWWIAGEAGIEQCGTGWEVHRGRRIDISIDSDNLLYLEIDLHHRFYTGWTLQQWHDQYPDIPISYVRNTYKKNGKSISWKYIDIGNLAPSECMIENLNISLAEYHLREGATEEEISTSKVVRVKRADQWNSQPVLHLSQRLTPSLTMDMLAAIADKSNGQEKADIGNVFKFIKKRLDSRIKEATDTAQKIIEGVYSSTIQAKPVVMNGYLLPKAKLMALNGEVDKVAKVRQKGCVRAGEKKFGCLNLYSNASAYPQEVERCLQDISRSSKVELDIKSYRTKSQFPDNDIDRLIFWNQWAEEGVKTVLVVMELSSYQRKKQIRLDALQAGIATQFIIPLPKADKYKAMNVVLGMLCKGGWQPVGLHSFDHPEIADLVIGFDTGTNRELYYGTSAFAILADGQSLGWELPDIQRGERFSGIHLWQTVSKLVFKFYQTCQRYPKKLLLMRDGLVQEGEFEPTIKALREKGIRVDVISVRKSGAGRMGTQTLLSTGAAYRDAQPGSIVFLEKERSFLLTTTKPINQTFGSVRPLKVVHEYGETSIDLLALQTYHLTQLHPASGFQSCRLPWVLHLADLSSKEFQRIEQLSILQNLSREKLIAV